MGTILASTIIASVAKTLQDEATDRRTTEADLFGYINAAQREAVILKPDISVANVSVVLVAGTKQTIPTAGIQLIKLVRNMGTTGTTVGNIIRMVDDIENFNLMNPSWHTSTASATVEKCIFDERDPKHFYVSPPQPASGFGYVEEIYSVIPADIVAGSGPVYTVAITIDDIYATPVIEPYCLYRAYAIDADQSQLAWERSNFNYNLFLTALGRLDLIERTNKPKER